MSKKRKDSDSQIPRGPVSLPSGSGSKKTGATSSHGNLTSSISTSGGGNQAKLNTLKYNQVGGVFVVGSGDCAQLGLGPDIFEKERPSRINYFSDGTVHEKEQDLEGSDKDEVADQPIQIVKIAAGGLHTLALSAEGKVKIIFK